MLTSNRLSPDRPHVGDGTASPVAPTHSQRRGISLDRVTLDPYGFWGRKQSINAEATLEHCASWMEQLGWLENFDRVARGEVTTERPGWQFSDSEVYKLLEAMAWQLSKSEDLALARSEEHTSELQSRGHLVCRLLLEKKKEGKVQDVERSLRSTET